MEMDWSPDFCLACDCQTSGDAYCSQACRLADLETSSCGSAPISPTTNSGSSISSALVSRGSHSGFVLPPAFDFSAYKYPQISPVTTATPSRSTTNVSYFPISPPQSQIVPHTNFFPARSLTTSSSRSSLTSVRSSSSSQGTLSDRARLQLRSYTSSFDHVRDWKRRMTSS